MDWVNAKGEYRAEQTERNWLKAQMQFINHLDDKINPISHLLALLGANHYLHVSGLRVKLQTGAHFITQITRHTMYV